MSSNLRINGAACLLAALCIGAPAHAADTTLLTAADKGQLASWLGEGPLALTRIFEKTAGATAADFHAAADGKGRTFSVMEARNLAGQSWLVGGYNPQSWSSKGGFNMTLPEAERTAFIFNLTSGRKFTQLPDLAEGEDFGSFQTLNDAGFGPTFGAGFDLAVPGNLGTGGTSAILSYSAPDHSQNTFTSILDGSAYQFTPNVSFGALEVYTISAVPEPATWMMGLAGLGMLAMLRRRKGRR
ncbi:MAG: PEP_CTERM-anchored TLD domain-containing protein [Pseudomonadota bacterium]